ncbi:MAG: trypsin-like peptidase domain-containing protein [Myxococcota bacterium]
MATRLDPFAPPAGSEPVVERPPSDRPPAEPTPPRRKKRPPILGGLLLVLIAVNLGLLAWLTQRATPKPAMSQAPTIELVVPKPAAGNTPLPKELGTDEKRTIELFRASAPSVVFITNLGVRRSGLSRNAMEIPQGTGSGFVWDKKGHIVTNFHVIRGAAAARVTFEDQTSFRASMVGAAPDKDIAVLKIEIEPDKLRPLPVGTSENLMVGQMTMAIGNPFGLDHTLSTGVVSGLEREIESLVKRPIFGVIQTDAAINPGNSGGPLLDSMGRLIGINTAIYSPSGASAGIGFAVPVDTVKRIVPQLIEHGRVIRPGLGISFDPRLNQRIDVGGVLIIGVQPGSAAEEAGFRPTERDPRSGEIVLGDVIVAIESKPVRSTKDLLKHLDAVSVGDTITVRIKREQKEYDVDVELRELE